MKKLFLCIFVFLFICKINASEIDLAHNAKSAILVETSTGKVLFEKNSNEKRSPASMTKIMTLLLAIEKLEDNTISLEDKVRVSKNAAGMGGTQIFIEENSMVDVNTLLKGIGIASANDASVAIAEYIGGSEEEFVNMMNKRARELGCENTNFKNPHGLDEDGHYTTSYDLSLIARELLKHPFALKITSTYEDYIEVSGENHWLVNTNKLIRFYSGIDGLKTGYTNNAGYCLTATMEKNNMRLLSIVMGEKDKDTRNDETIALLEYGFNNYQVKNIISKKDYEKEIEINNAYDKNNKYTIDRDVNIIVSKKDKDIQYDIKEELFDIKAPLKKEDIVGELKLSYDNSIFKYNLIIKNDVKKITFIKLFRNLLKEIISG